MGKQVVITKRRKVGGNSGYMTCNVCHGTGRQKVPNRKPNSRGKANSGR